ncbi:serine/arginine repetitive matrix protein 1 [Kryptolebias marmoratus]|uniref:serine/arginine repetitive matrix protein 1 n=1 Tax=Kryptolebias marmoratus TaxID=37003 RepID=UPI0007F91937|nr:serine/arginine repetitive matrix protein 1 [Kryptolebias marmoratus]
MYSHRFEYSHRRQDVDRSSRHWDDYEDRWDDYKDRWEGRPQSHREVQQDSCREYRDGQSSSEGLSRKWEFSGAPKDSLNRDWSRKSPVRRLGASPVWEAPEKKRRPYAEDDDRDFRYRCEPLEEAQNQSNDFKYAPPREGDLKPRRTPPDFRSRHQRDELRLRERRKDLGFSDRFGDKDYCKRRRDSSRETARSPDRFSKNYSHAGEMGSPPTSARYDDYQKRAKRLLNGSSRKPSEGDAASQSSSVPERKSSVGFQRFLDVLNKGVNVDALTKIVSQTSTEVSDEYISQCPLVNAVDRSWSLGCPERQQEVRQPDGSWGGGAGSLPLSPQPHQRSSSPNRRPASDENFPLSSDGRGSLSSKSPSAEKVTLTPEDEEKRKQMRDVLQAIGVDLGFDELGQMSHRIQERLYGKKNDDHGQKVNQGRSSRLASRHRSRSSSSSRSTFSPVRQDCLVTKDDCRPPRCLTELQQAAEYNQRIRRSFQNHKHSGPPSQKSTAAFRACSPTSAPSYTVTPPPPVPPINSPPPYPAPPPGLPPPPFPPSIGSGIFLPPMLPNPNLRQNILPPAPGQTGQLMQPQPQRFTPPNVNVVNPTRKKRKRRISARMPERTRYLQVLK